MSHITLDQLQHLAKLARLQLSPEQEQSLMGDMEAILWLISRLDEVDVDDALDASFAHTDQVSVPYTGVEDCTDDMLGNVKHPVVGGAIQIQS